ncbi:hypothetical protein [Moorena sp. SIO3A2]|uniref:hypothetical protein n=1 Tax=Moorena sp. SIO3A2 TaxID=2607841 RepID=UPI0013B624D2|nr:hypothetical protein [Moorena sp. SIO3A2]NER92224.1 hypothetical protein [Moorena sp. SIO3A2]
MLTSVTIQAVHDYSLALLRGEVTPTLQSKRDAALLFIDFGAEGFYDDPPVFYRADKMMHFFDLTQGKFEFCYELMKDYFENAGVVSLMGETWTPKASIILGLLNPSSPVGKEVKDIYLACFHELDHDFNSVKLIIDYRERVLSAL